MAAPHPEARPMSHSATCPYCQAQLEPPRPVCCPNCRNTCPVALPRAAPPRSLWPALAGAALLTCLLAVLIVQPWRRPGPAPGDAGDGRAGSRGVEGGERDETVPG